ncbi:MAG: hypothetical protein J0J01_19235 [Reyranella sp.]|uniref:hypothetical protein n=1 Tax=Reyranella sp. TaxID=1929291 RepID=UPI001AC68A59|nr:hypothetical protein [Reyranella sp.]MBN9089047.1 hypothetical protein [Reyranella sp.]
MSFVGSRVVAVLLAAVALPVLCQPAFAADTKRPAAPSAAVKAPEPSGAELVGKLLREQNGPSDPDVPLPQRGLGTSEAPASPSLPGPQVFGRREEGGGVFGLKFPIPVARGGAN